MKKILSIVLFTAMILTMFVLPTSAAAWDGTSASTSLKGEGTADKPFLVESAADLAFLAKDVNGGNNYAGKYITQTADIDLGGKEWSPIGADTKAAFSGVYNGCGNTIKGFYQSKALKFGGLFGYMAPTDVAEAGIANLTLEGEMKVDGATLTGHWSVAPLVGWSFQNTTSNPANGIKIINIVTDVDIAVTNYAESPRTGGVASYAYRTTFENVVSNGSITLNGKVNCIAGGIVAESNCCVFNNVVNNRDITAECVSGTIRAAGMQGYMSKNASEMYAKFTNSINNGDINAKIAENKTIYVAGFLAAFQGGGYALNLSIENCVNNGNLYGEKTGETSNYVHIGGAGGYPENGNNAITIKGFVNSGSITHKGSSQDRSSGLFGTIYSKNYDNIIFTDCICVGPVISVTFSVANKDAALVNCTANAEAAVVAAAVKAIEDKLAPSDAKIAGFDTAYKAPVVPEPPVTPETPETPDTPAVPTGDATILLAMIALVSLAGAVVAKKVTSR